MSLVPLNQAKTQERRRKRRDGMPSADDAGPCPVVPLGHADGTFWFISAAGEVSAIKTAHLAQRPYQVSLFGGNTTWLKAVYPQSRVVDGIEIESGFSQSAVCDFLMRGCFEAGIFGPHVAIRDIGLWADSDGHPAVHSGDKVFIGGFWVESGIRIGDVVYPIKPRQPRPGTECSADVCRDIEASIERLWNFRDPGASVIVMGLVATGLLGTAADWRPSGFFCADVGWGKSSLMDVMRAMCPLHHYTNDTSAAGIQGAINGRAMVVYVDEASDRDNPHGKQAMLDITLASSRGSGTRGHRGTADGKMREINLAGSFVYGSVAPPEMQPQHAARISVVHMTAPDDGADHKAQMAGLTTLARANGPGIWARMIAGFGRYTLALAAFREALRLTGCAPREMDQLSALLAGHWTLTREGVPDARQARIGVASIGAFVRLADDVSDESGSRRAIAHLMAQSVPYDSTTRQMQIGELIAAGLARDSIGDIPPMAARAALARFGIRVIGETEIEDRGRPVPRMADGAGIWLYPPLVRQRFHGSAWQETRWETEILRLPTARRGKSGLRIRFAANVVGVGIWIGRADFDPEEPVTFAELSILVGVPIPTLLGFVERADFPVALRPETPPNPRYPNELLPGWLFDRARVRRFLDRQNQDVGEV